MFAWWLVVWAAGCAGDGAPSDLCGWPGAPEVAALCEVQRAVEAAKSGDAAGAALACGTAGALRDECQLQVGEALARAGELTGAVGACAEAGELTPICLEYAAWILSDALVDAAPGQTDAQAAVDAFVEGLPPRPLHLPLGSWELEASARAAAWHGIYAGSGSAAPAAARAARGDEAALARGAFAWEAVRLLRGRVPDAGLIEAVIAVWEGERSPPKGSPLAGGCWQVRLTPRIELSSQLRNYAVRAYPGGARFVVNDEALDLEIAALDAAWAHGVDPPDGVIQRLLAREELPAQLAAARYVGLLSERYPQISESLPDRGKLRRYAEYTRRAAAMGWLPRPAAAPGGC
jgi:hypothetical protein